MKKAYALKKSLWVLLFILAAYFCSCSESESEVILYPLNGIKFALFPNDEAQNDSAAVAMSTGTYLVVHPNATYEISFDIDANYDAPAMQVFRTAQLSDGQVGVSKIMTLTPKELDGRYVYSFLCEENKRSSWAVTLVENDEFYKGKVSNVKMKGTGAYDNHLSINLIVVGKMDEIEGTTDIDDFASQLLAGYRKTYTNIVIDTLYVRYAHKHPTLGNKYPADRKWYAGTSSSDEYLSELGGWPEKGLENALDVILVHRIEETDVLGFAGLFASNLGGGTGSTVVIASHVLSSVSGEVAITSSDMVKTAIHETGHFFGLRHTTSTEQDIKSIMDASIIEDGFEDTPYCASLRMTGLYKKTEFFETSSSLFPTCRFASPQSVSYDVSRCPDAKYNMFPVNSDVSLIGFSKQELNLLKNNLTIIPH